MLKRVYRYPILFLALILLSAGISTCGPSEPEFDIKDKRELQGEKSVTTFNLDNSAGTMPLSQNYPVSKNYHRSVDLNLASNSRLDEFKVTDKIYNKYKLSQDDTKVCVVPVEIPAGQSFDYDLEWTQVLREGVVEEGANGGGQQLGTYRILVDLSCQVVGQRTRGGGAPNPTP